jgi:hypothetical protein
MSKVTIYVGLDYHKDSVQVCVMDPTGKVLANRSCPNNTKEIDLFVAFFGDDVRGAIEACTGAAELADELIRVPPRLLRFYALSVNFPGKCHLFGPAICHRFRKKRDETSLSLKRAIA